MKKNLKHLLVVGSTGLGAVVGGFMLARSFGSPPSGISKVTGSPATLQGHPGQRSKAEPAALPSPPLWLPSPEEILRQMGTAASEAAGSEAAVRMEKTTAEARLRVEANPESALGWAIGQGEMARPAMEVVLGVWAGRDPAAAFEALGRIPDAGHPEHCSYGRALLVEQWSVTDPSAAWEAVRTLQPSPETSILKGQLVRLRADRDPVAAAAELQSLIKDSINTDDQIFLAPLVATVASYLAAQDSPRAAEWALGFAEGSPERINAVSGVVTGWDSTDLKVLTTWIEGLGPGAARDAAASAMAQMAVADNPETSLAWAQTVSDPARRSILIAHAAQAWLVVNPEKAKAWIQTSGMLTAEQGGLILETHEMIGNLENPIMKR